MNNRSSNNNQAANDNALSFEPYIDRHSDWNAVRSELAESTEPLSRDEEREAFAAMVRAAIDGDDNRRSAIRDRILKANMRFALKVANKIIQIRRKAYGDYSSDLRDLMHTAEMAIIRAMDSFDLGKGTRFSTYAYTAIYKAIYELYDTRKRHDNDVGPMLSFYDPKVCDYIRTRREEHGVGTDPIPDEIDERWEYEMLWEGILSLPQREQDILATRFQLQGCDANLCDVARKYGISAARASQIVKDCEKKLRKFLEAWR